MFPCVSNVRKQYFSSTVLFIAKGELTSYCLSVLPIFSSSCCSSSPDLVVDLLSPGGQMQSLSFPSSVTSYDLTGLQPNTEYIITLFTLYEGREEATPVSTTPRGQ